MGLLSAFRRRTDPSAPAVPDPAALRTRARRRLIGATVLLGLAVIAFPLILETQPRPVALDIRIEIPRKDTPLPLGTPIPPPTSPASGAAPRSERRASGAVDGGAVPATVPTPVEGPAPAASGATGTASAVAAAGAARPVPEIVEKAGQQGRELPPGAGAGRPASAASAPAAAGSRPAAGAAAESERARALLEDRPAPAPSGARFVVQVGSFTEAAAVRETRQKVERLGVKTYTQVAEIDGVRRTRVRVGPFATREEADRQAAALRTAGLAASVLTFNP